MHPRRGAGQKLLGGSVAVWSTAPVLKTGDAKLSVSSNLTASASLPMKTERKSSNQVLIQKWLHKFSERDEWKLQA